MKFTVEEILNELKGNSESETTLWNSLAEREIGKGLFTAQVEKTSESLAEERAVIKAKELFEENIGKEMRKTHDLYDQTFFDLTGVKKNDGEKTYNEYLPRAIKELKNIVATEAKGADFESEVTSRIKLLNEESSKKITDLESANKRLEISGSIQNELAKIKLKDNLSDIEKQGMQSAIDRIIGYAEKGEDGSLSFKKDGEIIRGDDQMPLNAFSLLDSALEGVKPKQRSTGGGATQSEGSKSGIFKPTAQTKEGAFAEYKKHLETKGITEVNKFKEYDAKMTEFGGSEVYQNLK